MTDVPPSRLARGALLIALLAVTAAGLLAPARTADAATHTRTAAEPSIRVSGTQGLPGGSLLVSVAGFSPGERVALYVGPREVSAPTAGADGSITGYRIEIPAVTPLGPESVVASGAFSRFTAEARWTALSSPWGQPGGDAAQTGQNGAEYGLRAGTVAGLTRATVVTGPFVHTPPTVVDRTAYVGDLDAGAVVAYRVDGSIRWSRSLSLDAPLVVAGGTRVFAGAGGRITALDQQTGAVLWTSVLAVTAASFGYADGLVYVSGQLGIGSGVAAVSAATGQTLWTAAVPDAAVAAAPAVSGGSVVVRLGAGGVAALSSTDGSLRWSRTLTADGPFAAAVSGDAVVAASTSGLTTLALATGVVRWTSTAPVEGPIAVVGARVIGAMAGSDGQYRATALALTDGSRLWQTSRVDGAAAASAGVVFFARFTRLTAIDPTDGSLLANPLINTEPAGDFYAVGGLGAPSVAAGAVWVPVARSDQFGRIDSYGLQRFAVAGLDGVPAVRVLDDTATGTSPDAIAYTGGWVAGTRDGAYRGTFHYARSTGARASVTFSGVGVRIWYSQAPNFGDPRVLIDGASAGTLEESIGSGRRDGVKSWASPLLSPGPHTVVVQATSRAVVDVDRIDLGTS